MSKDIKNWEGMKELLLDGLNEKQAAIVGSVMESSHVQNLQAIGPQDQFNKIVLESTASGATRTSNISRYDMLFMPLIRRVMPALLAMNFVGVQTLSGPRGIVRTLRNRYSETTANGGPTAGTEASGKNVYDKYSLLALGDDYDAVDTLDPFAQTVHLEGNRGKPMDLEVVTDSVETKSRKLHAVWSLEANDDLRALDGLDLEGEVSASLSDEILRQQDRELINDLTALAGTVRTFDFANVDGRYAGEKLSAMMIAFDDLSAQIAMKTYRSGATWMLVSQGLFTGMKNANNSNFVAANGGELGISSSLYVGNYGNIQVYVDPYLETDSVLMGRKGSGEVDAGYFFLPYVGLESSGALQNPETFDWRIGMRTRYGTYASVDTAKGLGDGPDHFARMSVQNLQLGLSN